MSEALPAGGDRIAIDVDVGAGAQVRLTTPGATRWYRSLGASAETSVVAHLQAVDELSRGHPHLAIVFAESGRRMRGDRPFLFTNLKAGEGLDEVVALIEGYLA